MVPLRRRRKLLGPVKLFGLSFSVVLLFYLLLLSTLESQLTIMTQSSLPPELEARIKHLENPQNQGAGFTWRDWLWLWSLGVVAPILLLIWGWM